VNISIADIKFYGSLNMRESDSGIQGGSIADSGWVGNTDYSVKVVFDDLSSANTVQVVSSDVSDTGIITITGRRASNAVVSESQELSGTIPVSTTNIFSSLLKAVKSESTLGDIAVENTVATRNNIAVTGVGTINNQAAYLILDSGASEVNDIYNGQVLRLDSGTGSGQIRSIIDYIGSNKRAYVNRDWDVVPDNTTGYVISEGMVFDKLPVEIITIKRPFYNVSADHEAGDDREYYEKIFIKNTNSERTYKDVRVIEDNDPSGKVTFDLEKVVDGNNTSSNRRVAPASGGMLSSFDNEYKIVPDNDLAPSGAIGVWLKLSLDAGETATNTNYTLRTKGRK